MKCKNCGNILSENSLSCFLCGSNELEKIEKQEKPSNFIMENESVTTQDNVEKNKFNSKKIIKNILVLIVVLFVLTILCNIMKKYKFQYILLIIDCLIVNILFLVSLWKIFVKTGRKGFISLIPFYNLYYFTKIIIGNGWLFLFMLIPIVNFIFIIYLCYKLARIFGKSTIYAIGTMFLGIIFIPLLAFDDSLYLGIKKN